MSEQLSRVRDFLATFAVEEIRSAFDSCRRSLSSELIFPVPPDYDVGCRIAVIENTLECLRLRVSLRIAGVVTVGRVEAIHSFHLRINESEFAAGNTEIWQQHFAAEAIRAAELFVLRIEQQIIKHRRQHEATGLDQRR